MATLATMISGQSFMNICLIENNLLAEQEAIDSYNEMIAEELDRYDQHDATIKQLLADKKSNDLFSEDFE